MNHPLLVRALVAPASAFLVAASLAACGLSGTDPASLLRERFPAQAGRITGGEGGYRIEGRRVVAPPGARSAVAIELPQSGDEAVRFTLPDGLVISARELDASGAARPAGEAWSFEGRAGISYWTATPAGAEEWLLVEQREPGLVAAWAIEGAAAREAVGGVELVDASGEARLRVSAPEAFGEDGRAIGVWLAVRESRIELHTDARGTLLIDPSWSATTALAAARTFHTSTLLPNGNVLVAGGCTTCSAPGGVLSTTELYDATRGRWANAEPLGTPRYGHTATVLTSGKVLVAGGYANGAALASVELYDPLTGKWTAAAPMAVTRRFHSATVMHNGKVLVAGGNNPANLASAEVFDPATGAWTSAGTMAASRYGQAAVMLPNGKVLITGGFNGAALTGTEIYDPVTGAWSSGGVMAHPRYAHTATLLPNSTVLVAGGWTTTGSYQATSEIYDPASGWSSTGSMARARERHTATLLTNGKVFVTGGNDLQNWNPLNGSELYDPQTKQWTGAGTLVAARWNHTATLLANGRLLLAGGSTTTFGGGIADAETFDPLVPATSVAATPLALRTGATGTLLPSGRVLVAGGASGGAVVASAELYDPTTRAVTATESLASPRQGATATLLPNGLVLVVGGQDGGTALASAEFYDPAAARWRPAAPLRTARTGHSATLLPNGTVLVAGGHGGSSAHTSAEIFSLATGTWSATDALASARAFHTATLLANGLVLVTGGSSTASGGTLRASSELFDPATGKWRTGGSLAVPRRGHSATRLPNGLVLLAGGENGAALATAELYAPATNTVSATGALATARVFHTATLLPGGRVLVAGGSAALEHYDPSTGTWSSAGTLSLARSGHTATLLPGGQVLLSGGGAGAELFDEGRGAAAFTTPVVNEPSGAWFPGARVTLTGTLFTGIRGTEASGGGTQGSATNYPIVMLQRQDNEALSYGVASRWTPTSAPTTLPASLQPGWHWVRVISNGIPSTARAVFVGPSSGALSVSPRNVTLPPRGPQAFVASGGSGVYAWALSPNASGATLSDAGAYVAGTTCNVTDLVKVTDTFGASVTATVNVGACLTVTPGTVNLPPRGPQRFAASGGAGGYRWSLAQNDSGAALQQTGAYVAGSVCNVTDVVRVTDALGNVANATVHVGACLTIDPGSVSLPPRGSQGFTARGGSGAGYTWTLAPNGSGGTVSSTGGYVAGAGCSTSDVVKVTDSVGNVATATVTVGACLAIDPAQAAVPPRGSQAFTGRGGSGAGYRWTLSLDDPDAAIDPATGAFRAGPKCLLPGLVTLTDSLGNVATARVDVTACLELAPKEPVVPPLTAIAFRASGGSGAGFAWELVDSGSGGTISLETGAYVAGPAGDTRDLVIVRDSLGNHASTTVSVTSGISITPNPASVPPRGSQQFAVEGGSGTGYAWSVKAPGGEATITQTGLYKAGSRPLDYDEVHVQDSLGNEAKALVTVGRGIRIEPGAPQIDAGAAVAFTATGGSGEGWVWSLVTSRSGGTIDPATGAYRTGTSTQPGDAEDVVKVVDSLGNEATAVVAVRTPLPMVADGCDCACSSASNGLLAALGIFALRPRRRRGRLQPGEVVL